MSVDSLLQFIPEKLLYLKNSDKIQYKNINLKTDYLINIIHEIILKFYTNNQYGKIEDDNKFNLWSKILKKKYGMNYNYYIEYLIDIKFIIFVSNYYKNMKSKTYKINVEFLSNMTRCKVNDNILLKKHSKEFLNKTFTEINNSTIDLDIRKKLVDDLYHVNIDYNSSILYLKNTRNQENIDLYKFEKNKMSIESINSGNLFFKFDDYGRMHTNFTILKKHIRHNYLKIDNCDIDEIDIKNSQPLFLAIFLNRELPKDMLKHSEFILYNELVKKGLLYDYILDKYNQVEHLKTRNDVKLLIYKVFFGKNYVQSIENKIFSELFPNIYNIIKEYKLFNNNYKTLSHELQLLESDFIYNNVIKQIYNSDSNIVLFTVHDSIVFKKKDKNTIISIFEKEMNLLLNNL